MNEQETTADIIAAMRGGPIPQHRHDRVLLCHFADRLEAARKRERGDCAKLREALKHIKDRLPHMLQYMRVHWEDASAGGYFDELMLVIDAALDDPPRNCDRFATLDEAREAHEAICEKYGVCRIGCPLNNEEHYSAFDCFEAWLFAPATEKEGGNDADK